MGDVLSPLATHGVLGICLGISLVALVYKDRQAKAADEARIADSKASAEKLLEVAGKVFAAVDTLTAVADRLYDTKRGGTP